MKELKLSGYWWARSNNFGDMLTEALWESLTGKKIEQENVNMAKICGAGSILNHFVDLSSPKIINPYPLYVFGTGFDNHDPKYGGTFIRKLKIYTVRGKYSKQYVEKITGAECTGGVGDIGLLIKHIAPSEPIDKRYDLGIVPHYVDKRDERFRILARRYPKSKILSVQTTPARFVRELMKCKYVISTAMHPIIACDALRIPNIWAYLPNANQVDMSGKFNDYYSAFEMEKAPLVLTEDVLQGDIINSIEKNYDLPDKAVELKVKELEEIFHVMYQDIQRDLPLDILWKGYRKVRKIGEEIRGKR